MKKVFSKTLVNVAIIILAALLIVSIATVGIMSAHAQEEEPVARSIQFTSYTYVMDVYEDFTFSAEVTYSDGSVSDNVDWSSSNSDVLEIDSTGYAYSYEEGTAIITASVGSVSASVSVLVSSTAIRVTGVDINPESLELGVGWKARIYANVLPVNAYDQEITFSSNNPTVADVTADGYVTAKAAGQADIIATAHDGGATAKCVVTVIAGLEPATLSQDSVTMHVGEEIDFTIESPTIPEGAEVAYQWTTSDDDVASFDENEDETGTLSAWSFGTVDINVIVTVTVKAEAEGEADEITKYGASGTAYVTADFFYLTGLRAALPVDSTEDPWRVFDTAADAQQAGVLLVEDADHPGIFSITRELWSYDGFQILYSGLDEAWTNKITPYWYYAAGSSTAYVDNTADNFQVNARGSYIVTLDLTQGRARVSIVLVDLFVNEIDLSLAEGQNGYLQNLEDKTILDITTLPVNAIEPTESDIHIIIPEDVQEYVSASLNPDNNKQVVLELIKESTSVITFNVEVEINGAVGAYPISILVAGQSYESVSSIAFEQSTYYLNVNNGAQPWTVGIKAIVNEDATLQGVYYASDDLIIEYDENGNALARATKLGTFQVTAYAIGNTDFTATANVVVASWMDVEDANPSGFYLIGILNGERVANWTSIAPEEQTFGDSPFASWVLSAEALDTDPVTYSKVSYSEEFTFAAGDQFSIAFLGMNGSWDGVINNSYFNAADSDESITLDGINVQINIRGIYHVNLDLSGETPEFTVILDEELPPVDVTTYRYLYLVWGGSSWNGSKSESGNIIAELGTLTYVNGEFRLFTAATTATVDMYTECQENGGVWPTVQFVITDDMNGGDYFVNAQWYGTGATPLDFSGDAWSANPGTNGTFTNEGCQLYWVGSYDASTNMTVTFTCSFSESGEFVGVAINFVPATVPAE